MKASVVNMDTCSSLIADIAGSKGCVGGAVGNRAIARLIGILIQRPVEVVTRRTGIGAAILEATIITE